MAIVGIGVDVVDLRRFADTIERNPAMVDRLFTENEQRRAAGHELKIQSLAGRFAIKEAVAKAIGAPAGLNFHDCEVTTEGPPKISVRGTIAQVASELGVEQWHVSLTHDGPVAVAFVIAER